MQNWYVTISNKYQSGNNFSKIGMIHGKLFQNRHLQPSLILVSAIGCSQSDRKVMPSDTNLSTMYLAVKTNQKLEIL